MVKRSLVAALALFASSSLLAKEPVDMNALTDPPNGTFLTELAPEASGYWRPLNSVGVKMSLTVGYYFVEATWAGQTCGAHMKAIVALPKASNQNDVQYGEAEIFNASGLGATLNTPYNLLTSRYGYLGTISFVSYDPFQDRLTITLSTNNGPNGTYTLVRDLGPLIAPRNPC